MDILSICLSMDKYSEKAGDLRQITDSFGTSCHRLYGGLHLFRAVNRTEVSSVFLGLGAATKIPPIFLLPVFMQEEKRWAKRFLVASIALGVILVFNLPFMVCNFSGWLWTYAHAALWSMRNLSGYTYFHSPCKGRIFIKVPSQFKEIFIKVTRETKSTRTLS